MNIQRICAATLAIALVMVAASAKPTFGKLVLESDVKKAQVNPESDSDATSDTAAVIEREDRMDQAAAAAPAAAPVAVAPSGPSQQDIQSVVVAPSLINGDVQQRQPTKAEMLRRQRMREELKNEDLLTQRLEELRLKDELTRSNQIMSGIDKSATGPTGVAPSGAMAQTGAVAPTGPEALVEKRVGSAVAVAPTGPTGVVAPSGAAAPTGAVAPTGNTAATDATSATTVAAPKDKDDSGWKTRFSVNPRAGVSNILNSAYNIQAKFSAGGGISVDITEHFGVEGSYTYSQYGLTAALMNPYGYSMVQNLNMTDHVFDLGGKAYILGYDYRVRPFVGAGVSYRRGYVNYDNATLTALQNNPYYNLNDVMFSTFAGYIEGGVDFQLTKNFALTTMFRFYNAFSGSQSSQMNPNGYYNPAYGPYNNGLTYADSRASASNALATMNFYQITGGVQVSF